MKKILEKWFYPWANSHEKWCLGSLFFAILRRPNDADIPFHRWENRCLEVNKWPGAILTGVKLGYHSHTMFSQVVHFLPDFGSTVIQVAEWQKPQWLDWTELAFLDSENGNLLGLLFLTKDSEMLWFALGRMPVTLLPILLFTQNSTLFFFGGWGVSGFGFSCSTPIPAPSEEEICRSKPDPWGAGIANPRCCAGASDLLSNPAGLVFVK